MPKALKHFTTDEIDHFLETRECDRLISLLEEALVDAKKATDGCAAVQFFIDHELEAEGEDE